MTEKRFEYYEHKGADYILDTPNKNLDFIEMLGDCLEAEEIVDLLNELHEENEQLKKDVDKYNKKIEIMGDAFLHAEDLIDVEEVFFTEVYEPSENFDEELLCEFLNLFFSDYLSDKND